MARAEDARRYGIPLEDYERMLRLAKSGKFKVDFKPVAEIMSNGSPVKTSPKITIMNTI